MGISAVVVSNALPGAPDIVWPAGRARASRSACGAWPGQGKHSGESGLRQGTGAAGTSHAFPVSVTGPASRDAGHWRAGPKNLHAKRLCAVSSLRLRIDGHMFVHHLS